MTIKNYILFFCLIFISACSSPDFCSIKGKVYGDAYEGKMVYLYNPYSHNLQDSCLVDKGGFSFTFLPTDTTTVKLLSLHENSNDIFPVTLPVAIEKGNVSAYLGEKVLVTGTPLNDIMQDFLLATDAFSEGISQKEETMEEMKSRFADLIKDYIIRNSKNVIGTYIYHTYYTQLSPEQRTSIMEQIRQKEQTYSN